MMIHPAVQNYELLAARHLHIENTGEVNTCLRNQVPAGLNHQSGAGKFWVGRNLPFQVRQTRFEDGQVQRLLMRKVRYAEPSAKVETVERLPETCGNAPCNLHAL